MNGQFPPDKPTTTAGTRLENLRQPPLNTTMMGVLKGVAGYYGLALDAPMIFGLSGHAFLINIHTQLCPSGPYCWSWEKASPLIENLGLRMTDLGFFGSGSSLEARAKVEGVLRAALDQGIPCSLVNMDHQIIEGYDRTSFFTARPWPWNTEYPPEKLTFGSWDEFGPEFHASFFTVERIESAARQAAILTSLDYAVDLWRNPTQHTTEAFGVGPKAYDNWIAAASAAGSGHGNWWNATVWSECRRMAADYFSAIADDNQSLADLCAQLKSQYLKISENLGHASDKGMDSSEKIDLLKQTKELEAAAIFNVEKLAATLRA